MLQHSPTFLVHPVPAMMHQPSSASLANPALTVMHQYFPASLVHPVPAVMLQHPPARDASVFSRLLSASHTRRNASALPCLLSTARDVPALIHQDSPASLVNPAYTVMHQRCPTSVHLRQHLLASLAHQYLPAPRRIISISLGHPVLLFQLDDPKPICLYIRSFMGPLSCPLFDRILLFLEDAEHLCQDDRDPISTP